MPGTAPSARPTYDLVNSSTSAMDHHAAQPQDQGRSNINKRSDSEPMQDFRLPMADSSHISVFPYTDDPSPALLRTSSLSLIINSSGISKASSALDTASLPHPSNSGLISDLNIPDRQTSEVSRSISSTDSPYEAGYQTLRMTSPRDAYQRLSDSGSQQKINVDEDLSFVVQGRTTTSSSLAIYYFLCVITGGAYLLLCRWYIHLEVITRTRSCPLRSCSYVYLTNHWGEQSLEPVQRSSFRGRLSDAFPQLFDTSIRGQSLPQDSQLPELQFFEYRYFKFILEPISGMFQPNYLWRNPKWQSVECVLGCRDSSSAILRKRTLFEPNTINIQEKSTFRLLIDEVLHPFFIFQIASIILWCLDSYYQYAICIFVISTTSAIVTLIETKGTLRRIRELSRFSCQVRYWRDGAWSYGLSEELVPGDLFELESGLAPIVPCDAILLSGDCILNESMLTGESLPVSKSPATDQDIATINFEEEEPSSSSLRAGGAGGDGSVYAPVNSNANPSDSALPTVTNGHLENKPDPMATRRGAVAMAVRTGFNTTKGSLVRSIIFPRPNKFKFYQDSFRFIGVLSVIAGLGFISSLYFFIELKMGWSTILLRALDLITIVVPPALPATLAIGTSFAMSRLRQTEIFCTSPPRVNICGKINVMCFDKTGTLTQEGLDVLGVRFTYSLLSKHESPYEDVPTPTPSQFSVLHRNIDALIPASAVAQRIDFSNKTARIISPHSPSSRSGFSSFPSSSPYPTSFSGASLFTSRDTGMPITEPDTNYPLMLCAMAACHSIKVVQGALVGDPLDLRMFEFTGWHLEEDLSGNGSAPYRRRMSRSYQGAAASGPNHQSGSMTVVRPPWVPDFDTVINSSRHGGRVGNDEVFTELGVVREFEFVSRLRRMSVIVRRMRYWRSMCSSNLVDLSVSPTGANLKDMDVFVKGAPEVMRSICIPTSLPDDFDEQLCEYTHHGYRVIACAWRKLEAVPWQSVLKLKRSSVECDLTFIGFIVFENKLKAGTIPVVQTLHKAQIRQIMCTGDSLLTSVSVSRECGLVDPAKKIYIPRFVEGKAHEESAKIVWENVDDRSSTLDPEFLKPVLPVGHPLYRRSSSSFSGSTSRLQQSWVQSIEEELYKYELAITGDVFQWMLDFGTDETFERMLVKCQVFSRMSPDQKHFLVENLQHLGYCVGFCGDGANDCGALKAADIGLSLSEAEASVAAPFTSKSSDLDCVLRVIREGRVALVTSFSCFKYMALYSLIQFTTVSLLYSLGQNIDDSQFMYIDLMLIIPIAIFMGRTGPHPSIARKRPTASLSWYYEGEADMDHQRYASFENTAVFLTSCFQYIIVAVVFTVGPPYQEPVWKNDARLFVLVIGIADLCVSLALERFVSPLISKLVGRVIDHVSYTPTLSGSELLPSSAHGSQIGDPLVRLKIRKWQRRRKTFKIIMEDFRLSTTSI
ncbi:hypothetical protein BSLG_001765 [Batrachochytrium salamandrivorans]|nr:hypothetical protein BSLG_001765 [Batrachochytrium salamandrivorans]